MSSKYYPEFYLRRKRQQQTYLRVTIVVSIIVIAALGVVAGSYVFKAFISNRRVASGVSPQLADQQLALKTQEKLDKASAVNDGAAENAAPDEGQPIDLGQLEYAESFPGVSVSPEGLGPAAGGGEPAAGSAPAETPSSTGPPDANVAPGLPGENSAGASPEEDAGSTLPPPADAQAAADKLKKQQEADRLAKEKAKQDQAKKDAAAKEKARQDQARKDAEAQKSPEQPKDNSAGGGADSGKVRYRVYAGKFLSEDEAKAGKSNLAALGVGAGAQIIDTKAGDFLLLVTVLDGLEEANALRNKLSSSGFGGAFVTRKTEK